MQKCLVKARSLNQCRLNRAQNANLSSNTIFQVLIPTKSYSVKRICSEMMGTAWWLLVCTQNCFKQATISCEKYSSLAGKRGVRGNHVLFFFPSSSAAYVPAGHRVSSEDANMLLGSND